MKTFLFALFALFLIVPVSACRAEEAGVPTEELIIMSKNGKHKFDVEVAVTPQQLTQGLMFRSSMPEDHGMLFLFGMPEERNFWMKNTLIPLDIIYISPQGTINHIHENAVPHDETPLPSKGPTMHVLELNGGLTAKLGIKPGDAVYHGSFGNSLAQ